MFEEINIKVFYYSIFLISFMLLFCFTFVSVSFAESEQVYEVKTTNLNVRNAPSHDADVIGHLQPGQKVTAFKEEHGWVQTYYNDDIAWAASQYLSPIKNVDDSSTINSTESNIQVTAT